MLDPDFVNGKLTHLPFIMRHDSKGKLGRRLALVQRISYKRKEKSLISEVADSFDKPLAFAACSHAVCAEALVL